MKCRCCRKPVDLVYTRKMNERMEKARHCFECAYWAKFAAVAHWSESVRIDGTHYWIGREDSRDSRGFGGERFVIRFDNGRRVVTTNLWHQGEIPKRWRRRLPNNARFVKSHGKKELARTLARR